MIEYLSDPPHIFFVWLFCATILFILGLLFWMMRDSDMAEPATMLIVGLVATSILLGVEIMRHKAEKAEPKVNVAAPVEEVYKPTITQDELDNLKKDLIELLETLQQIEDAELELPDPREELVR